MTTATHKIRPAARLIRTIGSDLIKDVYAAIVELVKNAYDADSTGITISFNYDESDQRLTLCLEDTGHGMTFTTVVNKWLVPATDDKLARKRSEKGRILQGRKGIGRFAATTLGDRILLETTSNGVTTSLLLDMDDLEKVEYLDELDLEISEDHTKKPDGTRIEIEKDDLTAEAVKNIWTPKQLRKLFLELRSLIAPEEVHKAAAEHGFQIDHDDFTITLSFVNFPAEGYENRKFTVDPFPVLDLYDYKVSGKIDSNGNANLKYHNQNKPKDNIENIELKIPIDLSSGQKYPGEIYLDLRVYDRDPESIESIIRRGLKDPETNDYVGKQEARKILDEYYGIGIYREQFKVRPYGEQSFDWLDLDKKRVQNPSYKIGHNQVLGFIYIRPEEESGLKEKSARDGLVENGAYYGLIALVSQAINELEARRVHFRNKTFKGGRKRTLEDDLDSLFDFEKTKKSISASIDKLDVSESKRESINKLVDGALEKEKNDKKQYVDKVRDTIAIYQGQATLGKITHVLLHEGRKHIKYISETTPRVITWAKELKTNQSSEIEEKINDRSDKIISHSKGLSFLFKKLEPLARTRRSSAKDLNIVKEVESTFEIFRVELEEGSITYKITTETDDCTLRANDVDVIAVFSNLIENSIYWLQNQNSLIDHKPHIEIAISRPEGILNVEYRDNGPGFQGENVDLMFEPGYTMKPEGLGGTGLGLALAGEAMARIGGRIEAKNSESGAIFELIFEEKRND